MLLSYHRHRHELASVFHARTAERPHINWASTGSRLRPTRHVDCGGDASTPPACPRADSSLSSQTVWRLHGDRLQNVTAEEPILIPDGERYKQLATVGRIYDALIRAGADRMSAIVAVGGGVTGDIAGFAAATYLRGIPVVQVPTTLLAQVDSSVGGKVGVNHALGKNLIGAFHPPAAVVIDPELLATLPRREFRAGLYEVVKYGVIASRPLFERTSRGSEGALCPRGARAAAGDRGIVPHQGVDRRAGRARNRAPANAQFRPHGGPRARSGDEVSAVPARRGGGLRHARRGRARDQAGGVP